MDDKVETTNNPLRAVPVPIFTLPSFVTREWADKNIGNIQASDIRHISEKCRTWFSDWPTTKLDRDAFLNQLILFLRIPDGLRILTIARHKNAVRKRPFCQPVIDRVIAFMDRTDKLDDWRAIRKEKSADEVSEFILKELRNNAEIELLQEFIFVGLERGVLEPENIIWVHEVRGLEEIAKFAEAFTKAQDKTNIEPEIDAIDTDQYPTHDVDEIASPLEVEDTTATISQLGAEPTVEATSQLDTIEQAIATWIKEIQLIRTAITTPNNVPDAEFAKLITPFRRIALKFPLERIAQECGFAHIPECDRIKC